MDSDLAAEAFPLSPSWKLRPANQARPRCSKALDPIIFDVETISSPPRSFPTPRNRALSLGIGEVVSLEMGRTRLIRARAWVEAEAEEGRLGARTRGIPSGRTASGKSCVLRLIRSISF